MKPIHGVVYCSLVFEVSVSQFRDIWKNGCCIAHSVHTVSLLLCHGCVTSFKKDGKKDTVRKFDFLKKVEKLNFC